MPLILFQKAPEPKKAAAPRAPKATNGEAKAANTKKPAAKASSAKPDVKEKQVPVVSTF